jgi:hypothetical protein
MVRKTVARKAKVVERFQADLPCPDLKRKIFHFAFDPNHRFGSCRLVPAEGRIARRHERGTGCGGRESAGAASGSQGGIARERFHGAQDERRLSVRQNRVVPTPVAGAKPAEVLLARPGLAKP